MSDPLVLICPAMAVPAAFYRPLVAAFAERGWEARALPRRGFQRGTPVASRTADWSYRDEIQDLADAVGAARAADPERPVVVLGHSLGVQIAVGHDLLHEPADGLVLVGAGSPYHRFYPVAGLPVLLMGLLVPVVTRVRGFHPRPLFGAPGARTLMREWARWIRTGVPPFPTGRLVSTPALWVHLQGDHLAVSRGTRGLAEQTLDPATSRRWVYTKADVPPGGTNDHLHWVKTPDRVVEQVLAWWKDR